MHASNLSAGSGPEISLSYTSKDNSSSTLHPGDASENPIAEVGTEDLYEQPKPTPTSSLAVCFSSSDPVLEPSNDSRVPGAVGTIKREVGSHRPPGEPNVATHVENKLSTGQALYITFYVKNMRC